MIVATNPAIQHAIDAVAIPGVLVAHRLIATGDEQALLPEEFEAFAGSVLKVRRASGAARIVARDLLQRLAAPRCPIPKSVSGVPVWPKGIVGSLAHDAEIAVAAVAMSRDFASVGVDVEPAEPLDSALLDMIATADERQAIGDDLDKAHLLFSIKEAVYKTVYPLDGVFLDHHDVEVDLATGSALVRNGRKVLFRYGVAAHIVALAFIAKAPQAA